MIYWVTVKKKFNEKKSKQLNTKLECHITRPYALSHGKSIWYQMIPCQQYQNPISVRHVSKK